MIKYDLLVYIGRFQPFHTGHWRVVNLAMQQAHQLLILVGSPFQARTIKNPFTYDERMNIIRGSLGPSENSRTTIMPLRDYLYNDNMWLEAAQSSVDKVAEQLAFLNKKLVKDLKIGVVGYMKDESSYYQKKFPQWDYLDVGCNYMHSIDATMIRNTWLTKQSPLLFTGAVSKHTYDFMTQQFKKTEFERLCREQTVITDYRKSWANSPYEPTFVTGDAVVVQSGHILLVRRKSAPGEGLFACPGGYIQGHESIIEGVIRELMEETRIKVPEKVLRGSIKGSHVFDAPGRDLRGRVITHTYYFHLEAGKMPKVKGSDDADPNGTAFYPISEYRKMEDQTYSDHSHMINYFIGG